MLPRTRADAPTLLQKWVLFTSRVLSLSLERARFLLSVCLCLSSLCSCVSSFSVASLSQLRQRPDSGSRPHSAAKEFHVFQKKRTKATASERASEDGSPSYLLKLMTTTTTTTTTTSWLLSLCVCIFLPRNLIEWTGDGASQPASELGGWRGEEDGTDEALLHLGNNLRRDGRPRECLTVALKLHSQLIVNPCHFPPHQEVQNCCCCWEMERSRSKAEQNPRLYRQTDRRRRSSEVFCLEAFEHQDSSSACSTEWWWWWWRRRRRRRAKSEYSTSWNATDKMQMWMLQVLQKCR